MTELNGEKIVCKQCNFEFTLSEEEKQKFIDKGLEAPKRCKRCREHNKLVKLIRDVAEQVYNEKMGK